MSENNLNNFKSEKENDSIDENEIVETDSVESIITETDNTEKENTNDENIVNTSFNKKLKYVNKKKKSIWFKLLIAFFVLILITAVSLGIVWKIYSDDYNAKNRPDQEIFFVIEKDTAPVVIFSNLKKSGIISNSLFFRLYSKINKSDSLIKYGTFILNKNMTYPEILAKITSNPDVSNRPVFKFTIPEGYTQKQILKVISSATKKTENELLEALIKVKNDYDFLKDLPNRKYSFEGYLYPSSYEVFQDESAENIMKRLLDNFNKKITEANIPQLAKNAGFTLDEAVILASIIEKETPNIFEMDDISGVLHNRLKIDMLLQTDPTVFYSLDNETAVLTLADLKFDSPYNTYVYKGLPVGPISCPRIEAIIAACTPQENPYYFYLYGEGKTHFAVTYEEHLKNKDLYMD